MAQPTKSKSKPATKPLAKAASKAAAHAEPKLHYNKQALLADYTQTYKVFMLMLAIGIGGALVYFFILMVYLGGWGQTRGTDYVREFGERIQYDYKGLRLPEYDDPSLVQNTENTKH